MSLHSVLCCSGRDTVLRVTGDEKAKGRPSESATGGPPVVMLIAGHSTYLSRSLPKLCSATGARVVLASPQGCPVRWSRYVSDRVDLDEAHHDLWDRLERALARHDPALMIVVEEEMVERMARERDRLGPLSRRHFQVPIGTVTRLFFHQLAVEQGLAMPPGREVGTVEEAMECRRQWGEIFLKCEGSRGGLGVGRATTDREAAEAWGAFKEGRRVLAQKALHGSVGTTDLVAGKGEALGWISSEKWRTSRPHGPSIARRLWVPEGMDRLAQEVAQATRFDGFCGFDWVIDEADGRPKVIEFHPRPSSGFLLGRWAGVRFELALARLLNQSSGPPEQPVPATFRAKPICCYFPDHLLSGLRGRKWAELKYWLPGSATRSWSLVPWEDPGLMLAALARRASR